MSPARAASRPHTTFAEADRLLIALAPRTGLGDAWFFELLILEGQFYDAPDNLPLTALERALPEERDACE